MDHHAPTAESPLAGIDPTAISPAPLDPVGTRGALDEDIEFGFAPPDYDPDDYRWVPVKRQPRHDGWTEEKQRRFIEVLADTGLVSLAAKEVGMTRTTAYRLRRAPHAAAFARAWDLARERAGALIEDIAFERAIEGVEQEVYDGYGELKGSRTVYNDRLLTFLLRHLKPERYSRDAREGRGRVSGNWLEGGEDGAAPGPPRELPGPCCEGLPSNGGGGAREPTLDDALRAMEPALPAPAEELLGPEQLADDLLCAEIADGKLPGFHCEQRATKSPERLRAEDLAAQFERGRLASEKLERKEALSDGEWDDMCIYLDPTQVHEKRKKRRGARSSTERSQV